MGMGIILRDNSGAALACLSSSKIFSFHPIVVDFWALWQPMQSYCELGIESLQLEGDTLLLIIVINSHEACRAWYGTLGFDAK